MHGIPGTITDRATEERVMARMGDNPFPPAEDSLSPDDINGRDFEAEYERERAGIRARQRIR